MISQDHSLVFVSAISTKHSLSCAVRKKEFFLSSFLQKYMVRKNFLQNYTSSVVGMAAGTYHRAPRR
jgi:hypothetical protein